MTNVLPALALLFAVSMAVFVHLASPAYLPLEAMTLVESH